MAKVEKLFSKIVVIVFLVLIILGFMIPGFLHNNQPVENTYVEPRLCQSDADCYLTCNDTPVAVLCSQNLCVQNACDEYSLYEHGVGSTFTLDVVVEGVSIDIASRAVDSNIFVTFNDGQVQTHSPTLALRHVLDKVGIQMNSQCILVDAVHHCSDGEKQLQLLVNGEESFAAENFIPSDGDVVKVVYS